MTDLLDIDDFEDSDDDDTLLDSEPLDSADRKRLFTDRRRRVEELQELWRLRDELGLYDDELYC